MERLRVIDSHTGGEPTRVVVEGLPDLGEGTVTERVQVLERDFDRFRTAIIGEPRSSPVAVGAYLLPSNRADLGVIFFHNAGYLRMCGHGTIGLVATLGHLGRIAVGPVTIETPAGIVKAELLADGRASFENVASYRFKRDVNVRIDKGRKEVAGDIAYGGNWFFITSDFGLDPSDWNIEPLWLRANEIASQISVQGLEGAGGAVIDHVELVGPSDVADARNFVLCPGGQYDRSPCGTGTCAKLACLFEDGKLKEGQVWRQESIIGSVFEGSVRKVGGDLLPTITGQAYVNGDSTILIDPNDPFAWGIP